MNESPCHDGLVPVEWGTLRRLAERQADVLTRAQCRTAGVSDATLKWRVDSGRWVRLHEGVFLTKPGRADWEVSAIGALLRVDSSGQVAQAALCGRSAAYLWGLESRAPTTVELVVPQTRCVAAPPKATVRRSARWDDLVDERAYPWRTTRPVTVLDLAADGSPRDALAVVAKAVHRELMTSSDLGLELSRRRGHRHGALLALGPRRRRGGRPERCGAPLPPRRRAGARTAEGDEAGGERLRPSSVPRQRLRALPAHRRGGRATGA